MTKAILMTLVLAGGCTGEELVLGEEAQPQLQWNGIVYNALAANALVTNGLNLGNGLDLGDPDAHQFVEYLVSCALPAGDDVAIQGETFAGALGLAPEWADGPCGETCQRWVSACLLARVNARGERVQISMRGPDDALHPGEREIVDFPVEDGTFFGNLFVSPLVLLATSPREDLSLPRTCGGAIQDCAIDILGRSDEICAMSSPARGRTGCPYAEVVTVYLAP